MLLEWLRRRDPKFDTELRERLFNPGSIVAQEQASKGEGGETAASGGHTGASSLGIGSLKGRSSL